MSDRPKRARRAPKPLYVPDENAVLEGNEDVDSDYDMEADDDGVSVNTCSDEEEEGKAGPVQSSDINFNDVVLPKQDEYDMTDGFVVPDDYISEEDSDYSDSDYVSESESDSDSELDESDLSEDSADSGPDTETPRQDD